MKAHLILIGALLSSCLIACAGSRSPDASSKRVDFSFSLEQSSHRLSDFRGKPVVLVLMRTSELVSQIYMSRLSAAYPDLNGKVQVIALTVEPTEAPFVESYREIEKLPFSVGVAEPNVVVGSSELGLIPNIPFTYFINDKGIIVYSAPGVIEKEDVLKAVNRFFDR